jgi:hypothetical protein
MKFLLILFTPFFTYAQQDTVILPLKNGNIIYEKIVSDSLSKKENYDNSKRAFVNIFKSAKDVIQMDDKENGEIIGKGITTYNWRISFEDKQHPIDSFSQAIKFTIDVTSKDNKYRVKISDIIIGNLTHVHKYSWENRAREDIFENEKSLDIYYKNYLIDGKDSGFLNAINKQIESFIDEIQKEMNKKSDTDF